MGTVKYYQNNRMREGDCGYFQKGIAKKKREWASGSKMSAPDVQRKGGFPIGRLSKKDKEKAETVRGEGKSGLQAVKRIKQN